MKHNDDMKKGNRSKRAESGGVVLTSRRREYCRLRVEGVRQCDAYRQAYGKAGMKDKASRANAARQEAMPCIQAEIKRLQDAADCAAIATRKEILMYLTEAMRTPCSEIDEDSKLCQEVVLTMNGKAIKTVSRMDAVKELNRMLGHYEPEKVEMEGLSEIARALSSIPSQPLVKQA